MLKNLFKIFAVKKNCKTCRLISDTHCTVGTYLAVRGKQGVCYDGELWQKNLEAVKIFTPEFLKEIGFTLVYEKQSEFYPYQIYGCAKDRIGLTHIYWKLRVAIVRILVKHYHQIQRLAFVKTQIPATYLMVTYSAKTTCVPY
jgi:hypothetical protein